MLFVQTKRSIPAKSWNADVPSWLLTMMASAASGLPMPSSRRRRSMCLAWPWRLPSRGTDCTAKNGNHPRSEEHTSELQSLMRISYAVFCLKKKKLHNKQHCDTHTDKYIYLNKQDKYDLKRMIHIILDKSEI